MWTRVRWQAVIAVAWVAAACSPKPAATPPSEGNHHHELHLPPVGPSVRVTLDGKAADVAVASVPHDGSSVSLLDVWRVAFPSEEAKALHFDLVGSDGFHPASRPKCTQLLAGVDIAAARIDVVTHDISFADGSDRPGCYRVKAVVSMDATR